LITTPSRRTLAAATALALWLGACSAAWQGSSASGGDVAAAAAEAGFLVAAASRLSPACHALAREVVEAGMRRRIAAGRPTVFLLREREARALAGWEEAACPTRALPGMAYAVAAGVRSYREALLPQSGG